LVLLKDQPMSPTKGRKDSVLEGKALGGEGDCDKRGRPQKKKEKKEKTTKNWGVG